MISGHSRRIFVVGLVFLAIPTSLAGADSPEIHIPFGPPPPRCPWAGPNMELSVSGRVLFSAGDNGDSDNVKVTFQRYDPVTKKVFGVVITDSDTVNNSYYNPKTDWTVKFTPGTPPDGKKWYYKIEAIPHIGNVPNLGPDETSAIQYVQVYKP